MDLHLRGKVALVTGASKGIGLACARQLAEEGCHLHLASRTKADLERAKESIQARHNVSVTIHPVDLSNGDAARSLAAACSDIDILVNNAGAIPAGDLQAIDEQRWRDAWNLKVFGYVNLCRAVYPAMKARGGGVIVNVLGAAGERPTWGYIAGSAGNASPSPVGWAAPASSIVSASSPAIPASSGLNAWRRCCARVPRPSSAMPRAGRN